MPYGGGRPGACPTREASDGAAEARARAISPPAPRPGDPARSDAAEGETTAALEADERGRRQCGRPGDPADLSAEASAARTLESVARRLRSGALRLPVSVDYGAAPAALAAVLAALHAEERHRPSGSAGGVPT